MSRSRKVTIIEVGPRDGLQNESFILDQSTRREFIKRLCLSGLQRIEVGAFVSPRWIPQMAGSFDLIQKLIKQQASGQISQQVAFSALVPNMKGMQKAQKSGIQNIAFFTAASTSFTQKNINCTIKESLKRLAEIKPIIPSGDHLRSYISTAFYCPYEGRIKPSVVVSLTEKLMDIGCDEIALGDTIGVASPKDVDQLLNVLIKKIPAKYISMHFHDTRGMALANIKESLDYGIRTFDSSLGGLGGCPYAQNSTGNVATEDVVYFLERLGYKTNIDLQVLIKINYWLSKKLKHALPSRIGLLKSSDL